MFSKFKNISSQFKNLKIVKKFKENKKESQYRKELKSAHRRILWRHPDALQKDGSLIDYENYFPELESIYDDDKCPVCKEDEEWWEYLSGYYEHWQPLSKTPFYGPDVPFTYLPWWNYDGFPKTDCTALVVLGSIRKMSYFDYVPKVSWEEVNPGIEPSSVEEFLQSEPPSSKKSKIESAKKEAKKSIIEYLDHLKANNKM